MEKHYCICAECEKEMAPGNGCTYPYIRIDGEDYTRTPYGLEGEDWGADEHPCHDCNVTSGQYHHYGCDVERCPRCGGQLISCDCKKQSISRKLFKVKKQSEHLGGKTK